ncbi:23S rRNA (uracil(1939)-C(5))-methyltransferase RlmD [Candidatus Endomicrobiellum agilis]|uniref:23S rRNA (uracil(1939)-C(5))-methyltransferase RlmD n=1 Tax=Candidatus Endomicrobiellum agilis TaxID=3238957 RepID=UPI003588D2BE|nr:23S rRNA (uracil(1939)-C(5))-methyltransferase RlmD [Endomicrobium sp.]
MKNKIIDVKAEKIVFPGRSLCRCSDGTVLFTEGLLPGEIANVLVTKDKKTFREGLLKSITSESVERIKPLCSSFGFCGGCSFQNVSYENQIKYKQKYISELLSFTGTAVSKILSASSIWYYRNKVEFSFFNNKGVTDLGFHCKGSFDRYVSVPPCFISDKDFLQVAETVKRFANENNLTAYNNKTHEGFFRHLVLRKAKNNNQLLINIVTNNVEYEPAFWEILVKELGGFSCSIYWTYNGRKSDAVLADKVTLIYGEPFITEKLNIGGKDYFFNISPFSFFQTNSKGTEILYNEVLRLLNQSENDILLDLYCGTGTIGVSMAGNVKKVIGIEQVAQAVDDAKENALANNVFNAGFYASTVEDWVKENKIPSDAVVVDPPRSGLTKDVIRFLLESKSRKIVYVSCNPSTLARDLQLIVENGKYKVKEITPVDMFPQTYHIEIVVLLEL